MAAPFADSKFLELVFLNSVWGFALFLLASLYSFEISICLTSWLHACYEGR